MFVKKVVELCSTHNGNKCYSTPLIILSLANFKSSCFCPISLKNIVALISGLLPSRVSTLPKPKRSCSTCMPTCRFDVSEGLKSGDGTCALANIDVVLTGGAVAAFGFEKVSFLRLQALRSSSNEPAAWCRFGCKVQLQVFGIYLIQKPAWLAAYQRTKFKTRCGVADG
jgi:hypothetical protein